MITKRGLGKGLDALFDNTEVMEEEKKDLVELKISLIEPSEQPRKAFDEEALRALSDSIKEHGVIQPIIVTSQENGFYRIIAGERRWRAAKMAGLSVMPAIVRSYEDKQAAEITMIENLQREDLNPIEEAAGYKELMEKYGMTQEQVSERLGKSRPAIANAVRLLSLPDNIIQMVRDGLISGGHARTLLAIESETEKQRLAEQIINDKMSVRDLEKTVSEKKKAPPKKKNKLPEIIEIENKLTGIMGTKVKINDGAKKGKIEIEYYGNDDLCRILSLFGRKNDA